MIKPKRGTIIYYYGLMDELDLDFENTYICFVIYHSILPDSDFYNTTKQELTKIIHQSMRTLYRRIKALKQKGLIEKGNSSTGWVTTEQYNKAFESYRDEIHPEGYDNVNEAFAEELYKNMNNITLQ